MSKTVAVIGSGPAGLIAAERLAAAGVAVTVHDRMPSPGRKFLLAGRGGLNLTHTEPFADFVGRYADAAPRLRPILEAFRPEDLADWAENLGEATFAGSSGRVFPKSFKASPLLRKWLARLDRLGVRLALRRRWTGWTADGALRFEGPEGEEIVRADAVLLALGGASWPRMGSDGAWTTILAEAGVPIAPLRPSNMGFEVEWSEIMRRKFAGEPIKRAFFSHKGRAVRGEAVVTEHGIEGGAVYALSAPLRETIAAEGSADLMIDLRPDMAEDRIAERLSAPRGKASQATFLHRAAGLSPVGIALMRESTGGPLPSDARALARLVKAVPIRISGMRPIERAISTAGGVRLDAVEDDLMLKALPGVFVAGEMLDWEAPTGGYLLTACFATGVRAAEGILKRG
jgi:uncharacterized flavoprotein (TIGR03862 family)